MLPYPKYGVIWSVTRAAVVLATVLLVTPFVAFALAPVLLLLVPLTFIAIPFMILAFLPGAAENHSESLRIRARRPITLQVGVDAL
jgi:hypothetical protein